MRRAFGSPKSLLSTLNTICEFRDMFVALAVVSVCRAMLSIKSLAATMHVDPGWLLNHAELSRVHWRPGTREGEIVVEALDDSYELPVLPGSSKDAPSVLSTDTDTKRTSGPSSIAASLG